MTKQEVQNNIQHNENLANQCQWEINNLNAQVNSLNSRINQLNIQIAELRAKKQTLEREVNELERLRTKLQGLRDDFGSRQARRVSGFNRNVSQIVNVRFIMSYISGMHELLAGQEYRNTYNGLTSSLERVAGKIQTKQREIESLQNQINNAQRNIDSMVREIGVCRSRINQRSRDQSYYKSQAWYWSSQMQYAI